MSIALEMKVQTLEARVMQLETQMKEIMALADSAKVSSSVDASRGTNINGRSQKR